MACTVASADLGAQPGELGVRPIAEPLGQIRAEHPHRPFEIISERLGRRRQLTGREGAQAVAVGELEGLVRFATSAPAVAWSR